MPRARSIKLMSAFGIRIGVHPSWFVVLFLIIWLLAGTYRGVFPGGETTAFAVAVATAFLFFGSVIVHELGHALVAVRNGVGIAGIDLWLFGGVARMRREPPSPGVDLRVALAGPAVTLALVVVCALLALAVGGGSPALAFAPVRPGIRPVEAVLSYLALINALLLVLNLIPGFPLDGGRVVRALAWARTGDRARATRLAASVGRGFGLVFVALGLALTISVPPLLVLGAWMVLIGLFLTTAARASESQSRFTSHLHGLSVSDVMDAEPVVVPATTSLDRLLEEFFLRYRFAWFPVVDSGGRFLGLVRQDRVEEVPEDRRPTGSAEQVLSSENAAGVKVDEPVEALLGSEELRRLGAVVALDGEGVLRGVVSLSDLQRTLRRATEEQGATGAAG